MKYIIIDSNEICYISLYSQGYLSFDGRGTGVIFGFLRKLLEYSDLFQTTNFIFCFDSSISYRKTEYPEYKGKRLENMTDEQREACIYGKEQFRVIRKFVLPNMGFRNIFLRTGFESDDIIAYICNKWDAEEFVIVSSDEDLYQLLSDRVTIYKPRARKFFTADDFDSMYRIDPSEWSMVKAIAGCDSDNIAGVQGVGEKTAIQFLQGQITHGKKWESIMYGLNTCGNVNLNLTLLPHKQFRGKGIEPEEDELDFNKFIQVFERYGFASFLKMPLSYKWRNRFFGKSI